MVRSSYIAETTRAESSFIYISTIINHAVGKYVKRDNRLFICLAEYQSVVQYRVIQFVINKHFNDSEIIGNQDGCLKKIGANAFFNTRYLLGR